MLNEHAHSVVWKGRSGIRIALAPPATPECQAIQPRGASMTSTISTRWSLSRRRVQPIDGLSGNRYSRVEAECVVGGTPSVVDGPWDPDDGQARFGASSWSPPQRVLPSDDHQPVDLVSAHGVEYPAFAVVIAMKDWSGWSPRCATSGRMPRTAATSSGIVSPSSVRAIRHGIRRNRPRRPGRPCARRLG